MALRLAQFLLPVALVASACTSDGASGGVKREPSPQPTAVGTVSEDRTETPAAEPTAAVRNGMPEQATPGGLGSPLLSAVNPLNFFGTLTGDAGSSPSSRGEIDPELETVLLDEHDLPGFFVLKEDVLTEEGEYGPLRINVKALTDGEGGDGDPDTVVLSGAVQLPAQAISSIPSADELPAMAQAELERLRNHPDAALFRDLRLLDATGLGDLGIGIHWVPVLLGIAIDTYEFIVGEHGLIVMVMWTEGEPAGVDSRGLADILNEKATAALQ